MPPPSSRPQPSSQHDLDYSLLNSRRLPPLSSILTTISRDDALNVTRQPGFRPTSGTMSNPHPEFIDLTAPSPSISTEQQRHRNSPSPCEPHQRPAKRRRTDRAVDNDGPEISADFEERWRQLVTRLDPVVVEDLEEIDLTAVDDDAGLARIQEDRRQRHEKLQEQQNALVSESVKAQTAENKGPIKLGQLQCVICMDNMTDMATTLCGMYSHA